MHPGINRITPVHQQRPQHVSHLKAIGAFKCFGGKTN
jgi:hypothetical protein